jgi:hypothetical protein
VQEEDHRSGISHVLVDGDDTKSVAAERFQYRLYFALQHRNIARDYGLRSLPKNAAQVLSPIRALIGAPISLICISSRPTVIL